MLDGPCVQINPSCVVGSVAAVTRTHVVAAQLNYSQVSSHYINERTGLTPEFV